jgi:hypothetical protein
LLDEESKETKSSSNQYIVQLLLQDALEVAIRHDAIQVVEYLLLIQSNPSIAEDTFELARWMSLTSHPQIQKLITMKMELVKACKQK